MTLFQYVYCYNRILNNRTIKISPIKVSYPLRTYLEATNAMESEARQRRGPPAVRAQSGGFKVYVESVRGAIRKRKGGYFYPPVHATSFRIPILDVSVQNPIQNFVFC